VCSYLGSGVWQVFELLPIHFDQLQYELLPHTIADYDHACLGQKWAGRLMLDCRELKADDIERRREKGDAVIIMLRVAASHDQPLGVGLCRGNAASHDL
jgi:hypothetical protein